MFIVELHFNNSTSLSVIDFKILLVVEKSKIKSSFDKFSILLFPESVPFPISCPPSLIILTILESSAAFIPGIKKVALILYLSNKSTTFSIVSLFLIPSNDKETIFD